MTDRIQTYKKFWPFYLQEHDKPRTQKVHALGTYAGLGAAALAIVTGTWWLPLAGLAVAYGCAWTSHAFTQKNKPATFKYPLWSFVSDFRMAGLWTVGRLSREFAKQGVQINDGKAPAAAPPAPEAPKA